MSDQINQQDYRVLLVEDDPDMLAEEEEKLASRGYKTYTAESGETALDILESNHVDIIIIDYYLDKYGLTGEDTIMKVREFDPEVIIVLQTGFADEKPALRMLESLKIQGYYDKSEGREKLLIWTLSAARACQQQRELKRAIQKVEFAHKTLNDVMKDQSRMIEQVRLASLGQKMGSIFHDMSNPLSAIESNIEYINNTLADIISEARRPDGMMSTIEEKAEKMTEKCSSCNRRVRFIRDMRNTVVAQSRQESVNKWEKFSVDDLLETVKFLAEDDIKKYKCTISVDNRVDSSIKIAGKKVSLVQVLNNLITNSSQAYEQNGKIDIVITNEGENIKFVVKDWAGGMSPDIKAKLLKEMVTTKGSDGNGIGVYTSYLTVRDYFGGNMWFDSVEGEGTTFYITIPYTK